MTSIRHTVSCMLAILVVCLVALGNQTEKQSAPAKQNSLPVLSAQEIFKRVSPSVMVVESLDAEGKANKLGSGVVIATGKVITNRHVIEGGVTFCVEHNGEKWPAKLIKVDPDHDLAELSVAGLSAPAVTALDSAKLAVGETVYAIGSPEGLELTISEGLISGLRDFDKGRVIQTSAAISPGSSGGGLFDARGHLVGITTFQLKEGQNLNFALPAEWTLALNRRPASTSATGRESSREFEALTWVEAGYAHFQAGEYAQAVRDFREAIRLKADYEGAWVNLGGAYHGLGEESEAVSAEQEALRIKPDDEVALNNIGVAYMRLGQYEDALSAEQRAVRLKPDYGAAWFDLGLVYSKLGQYSKAVTAEEEAVRLETDDASAWAELGFARARLGQYADAIRAYQRAVRLNSDRADTWYDLGVAYKLSGDKSQVIMVYKKLKSLDPISADQFFREEIHP